MKKISKGLLIIGSLFVLIGTIALLINFLYYNTSYYITSSIYNRVPTEKALLYKKPDSDFKKVVYEDLDDKDKILYKMLKTKDTFNTLAANTEVFFYTELENMPRNNYLHNKEIVLDQTIKKSLSIDYFQGALNFIRLGEEDEYSIYNPYDKNIIKAPYENETDYDLNLKPPKTDEFIRSLQPKDRVNIFHNRKNIEYFPKDNIQFLCDEYSFLEKMIRDKDSWIVLEETTYLNRPVYHLAAKAADERPWVNKISLIVDKETGLVLEKTEYDKHNEIFLSSKVNKLELNQTIDGNTFNLDYNKY